MAPNNVLPIYGNEKTMNLNPLVLANIQASPYFKVHLYELKSYHQVIDEIFYKVNHLEPWEKGSRKVAGQTGMCGGVRGVGTGGIVSSAFCLLYKLYTLKLTRKQVVSVCSHADSPFIRALGLLYIRYTQPPNTFWEMYEPYLDDEEEVDPKAGGGNDMTIGEMCEQLLTKLEWYGTLFPRIPVPIMKDIDAKLRAHKEEVRGRQQQEQQALDAQRHARSRRGSECSDGAREGGREGSLPQAHKDRMPQNRSGSRDRFGRKRRRSSEISRSRSGRRKRSRSARRDRGRSDSRRRHKSSVGDKKGSRHRSASRERRRSRNASVSPRRHRSRRRSGSQRRSRSRDRSRRDAGGAERTSDHREDRRRGDRRRSHDRFHDNGVNGADGGSGTETGKERDRDEDKERERKEEKEREREKKEDKERERKENKEKERKEDKEKERKERKRKKKHHKEHRRQKERSSGSDEGEIRDEDSSRRVKSHSRER